MDLLYISTCLPENETFFFLFFFFSVWSMGFIFLLGGTWRVRTTQTLPLSSNTEHACFHVQGTSESHFRNPQITGQRQSPVCRGNLRGYECPKPKDQLRLTSTESNWDNGSISNAYQIEGKWEGKDICQGWYSREKIPSWLKFLRTNRSIKNWDFKRRILDVWRWQHQSKIANAKGVKFHGGKVKI